MCFLGFYRGYIKFLKKEKTYIINLAYLDDYSQIEIVNTTLDY